MLNEEVPRLIISGNNTRGPWAFSVSGTPITFLDKEHIQVWRHASVAVDGVALVLGVDYDISVNECETGDPAAEISLDASEAVLASGQYLRVERGVPNDQPGELAPSGGFSSAAMERYLDILARQIQDLAAQLALAVRLSGVPLNVSGVLPAPVAGKVLGWNDDGDGLANLDKTNIGSGAVGSYDAVGGETQVTVSEAVSQAWLVELFVNSVRQLPGEDYTADGSDELTLAAALSPGDEVAWIHSGATVGESALLGQPFVSGDATPSVSGGSEFITTGSTTITDFDDGVEGQVITVMRGAIDITIADNANIDTILGVNLTLTTARPMSEFRLESGVWKQVGEAGAVSTAMSAVVQGTIDQAMEALDQGAFTATGATATRSLASRFTDWPTVKDYGAVGDNSAEDGDDIAEAIAAKDFIVFPTGTYKNTATACVLPFDQAAMLNDAASIANSGSGSFTANGARIYWNYNPSGITGWTTATGQNREGFAVDLGGFGARSFNLDNIPLHAAIVGAVSVPSGATVPGHGSGLSGYARNASTTTNAVAMYGQTHIAATNALGWGFNTTSNDEGFETTLWGGEIDLNVFNVNTVPIGLDLTGASTVEPANGIALRVGALGTFASPKKRWARALFSDDGCAILGLELGATLETNSGSQPIRLFYRNGSHVRTEGGEIRLSSDGSLLLTSSVNDVLIKLQGKTGGALQNNVTIFGPYTGIGTAGLPLHPLEVGGTAKFNAAVVGSVQSLSGAGAINVTTTLTKWTTTGANAATLADGVEGQEKEIVLIVDGGDGTLTPSNLANGTTITFNDVGDSVVLRFLGTEWWVISNDGCTIA